jgi:hypothetical protein
MAIHLKLLIAAFITALTLFSLSCSTGNSNNASNGNSGASNKNATGTSSSTSGSLSTPTDAFRTVYNATKNKDIEGFKKTLSADSLKWLEDEAKKENMSLDQEIAKSSPPDTLPETRNEKIDGNTASLETKDSKSGDWQTLYFVKEGGEWKLDIKKSSGVESPTPAK